MRYFIAIVMGGLFLASCKKDKYTTAPQITYKSIENNVQNSSTPISNGANARIIFSVTDGEGDLGLKSGKDTAYIFVKSLLTNDVDSVLFPDLSSISKKDFKATVTFGLTNNVLKCRPVPGNLTHVDTIYYEVYVRDFAKNKSNVIRTGDPVFLYLPIMRFLQFILSHSIFISICAAALCMQTNILLHIPHDVNIYGFILCSTLCSYNFYWLLSKFYFSNRTLSLAFAKRHFSFILLFVVAGAGMLFFLLHNLDLLPYIFGGLLLTLLYSLPLWPFPFAVRLQKAGFFKTTLLALTWAYVTVILPAAGVLHTEATPILSLLLTRFCFMLLLCIIFDMRDISVDKMHGLRSLATDLSKRTLSIIINIVFVCFFISGLLVRVYFHDNLQMIFFLLTGGITFFVYRLSLKPQGYIFYYFLVDGLMLISAAGTLIADAF